MKKSIYFVVEKKRWRGRKKSGFSTSTHVTHITPVPHTIRVSFRSARYTKNLSITHSPRLSHTTYNVLHKKIHLLRKKRDVLAQKHMCISA